MKTMAKRIPAEMAKTRLEKVALQWLNREGADYEDGAKGAYKDLMEGGCASGIVSADPQLVYYVDTAKFYRQHHEEIDKMLEELCEDTGETPAKLFDRAGWDTSDPLARKGTNINLLAWFGFEEAAKRVMEHFCPEIA